MTDYCKPGDVVCFPNQSAQWLRIEPRYDYHKDSLHCPVCGGIGYAWLGWFTCDDCPTVAIIHTGEVFQAVP